MSLACHAPSPLQKVKPTRKGGGCPGKKRAVVILASFQADGGQQRRPPAAIYLFQAANQKPSRVFDLQTRLGNNALPWRPSNPHFCQELVIFGHFSSHFCQLWSTLLHVWNFCVASLSTFYKLFVDFLSTFCQLGPPSRPNPFSYPNNHAPAALPTSPNTTHQPPLPFEAPHRV